MTKTLIDVDNELLDRAGAILGTTTKKDAVNRALRDVVEREERAMGLRWLQDSDALGSLGDPKVRAQARR